MWFQLVEETADCRLVPAPLRPVLRRPSSVLPELGMSCDYRQPCESQHPQGALAASYGQAFSKEHELRGSMQLSLALLVFCVFLSVFPQDANASEITVIIYTARATPSEIISPGSLGGRV